MSCCTNIYNTCLIRGTNYTLDVGLTASFAEVVANPDNWVAVMVFRDAQDDSLPQRLTLTAVPVITLDDPTVAVIRFFFAATPLETAALPDWNLVYYVDLVSIADNTVNRLFQGACKVSD